MMKMKKGIIRGKPVAVVVAAILLGWGAVSVKRAGGAVTLDPVRPELREKGAYGVAWLSLSGMTGVGAEFEADTPTAVCLVHRLLRRQGNGSLVGFTCVSTKWLGMGG